MRFDVNAVLQKADLLAYVERAGGNLKKNGDRYSCACPLHFGDNPTAFSVYQKDGRYLWNCFTGPGCGGGDAITFIQKFQNLNFKQACEWIMGGQIEDSETMLRTAQERLRQAELETIAAAQREDARRQQMRVEERHNLYHANLASRQWMRETWTSWGIDEGMQDFWNLGGCDDFFVDGEYHTPTLTIPVENTDGELMTIQHRLINPKNPKDKYRPDRKGLHAHPFLTVPRMGYDGGIIWVMEGAKKAMVTCTRSDVDWQCIGVPGQEMYKHLIEKLRPVASRVIVVPDPKAETKALLLAKELNCRFLELPQKIDDHILMTEMKQDQLYKLFQQSRKV